MKELGALILLALVLVVALLFGLGYANDSAASRERARGQAEAAIIQANGLASLNRAEAAAIRSAAFSAKMLAMLPWGILATLGILGLAVVALAGAVVVRRPAAQPTQIIERQIVYLPPPGTPRREVWQQLSASRPAGLLVERIERR